MSDELQEREEAIDVEAVLERIGFPQGYGRRMPPMPAGVVSCAGCIVHTSAHAPAPRDGLLKRENRPPGQVAAGAPLCPECLARFDAGFVPEEVLAEAGLEVTPERVAAMRQPVEELGLSKATTKALRAWGMTHVVHVAAMRAWELRAYVPRVGTQAVRAIAARLREQGLALRRW